MNKKDQEEIAKLQLYARLHLFNAEKHVKLLNEQLDKARNEVLKAKKKIEQAEKTLQIMLEEDLPLIQASMIVKGEK